MGCCFPIGKEKENFSLSVYESRDEVAQLPKLIKEPSELMYSDKGRLKNKRISMENFVLLKVFIDYIY